MTDAPASKLMDLRAAARDAVDYLNSNALNSIGAGSRLHRQLIDALQEQPRETRGGWQPIETAPRALPVFVTGFIRNDESAGRWRLIAINRGDGWYECSLTGLDSYGDLYPPTHWMPLPSFDPPPQTTTANKGACKHLWKVDGVRSPAPEQMCANGCGTTWAQRNAAEDAVECKWQDGCRLAGVCERQGACQGRIEMPDKKTPGKL